MRPLALALIYEAIGELPDAVAKARDRAMEELTQIRDGAFTDLPLAEVPVQTITPRAGVWGSETKIKLR